MLNRRKAQNFKTMKAIQIQFSTEWFGVKFKKDLFLTDRDVSNILNGNPEEHQGYYTRISKVTELHTKKLLTLAEKHNRRPVFKIYDIN